MDNRTLFVFLLAAAPLSAQTISLGLIGGASLTDAVRDVSRPAAAIPGSRVWSQSKDWLAGGMIELHFSPSLSVEGNGIYRELHMTWANILPDGTLNSVSPSPVVTWEFPVLAKYRFQRAGLKPFIEAGPSFRTTGNLNFTPSHVGATAGLGFETRWRGFDIAPTLRYTHWAPDLQTSGRRSTTQLNQLEMLVSFSRQAESSRLPTGSRVSLGAVAGWGLNADLPSSTTSGYFDYLGTTVTWRRTGLTSLIGGPSVEIHLRPRLSVEVDALHKSLRTRAATTVYSGQPVYSTDTEAATWQFPVLAKYRFGGGRLAPFAEAGPSFRLPQWALSTHGLTGGAGVDMRFGSLRVAPTLRFTHWGPETGAWSSGVVRNEASLLVSLCLGGGQR